MVDESEESVEARKLTLAIMKEELERRERERKVKFWQRFFEPQNLLAVAGVYGTLLTIGVTLVSNMNQNRIEQLKNNTAIVLDLLKDESEEKRMTKLKVLSASGLLTDNQGEIRAAFEAAGKSDKQ
jgi:hypothetical protein